MNIEAIDQICSSEPKFRVKQIHEYIFKKKIKSWDEATSLPKALRDELNEKLSISINAKVQTSGTTVKALIKLDDGKKIEAVLMKAKDRNTVCVSSQVGCPMNCAFCATGNMGFKRNLTVSEIVEQVLYFERMLADAGQKVTNIVFMGMGEPLLNFDNLITSIEFMKRSEVFGLGSRRFSISTCGILPELEKLAELEPEVNLAISLHAANDELRSKLMPVNNRYNLAELAKSIKDYYSKTKRKVMFEYILLSGVNCDYKNAKKLAGFLNSLEISYVLNLIPYNEHKASALKAPARKDVKSFEAALRSLKVNYVQRYRFGDEIAAACGQLAGK